MPLGMFAANVMTVMKTLTPLEITRLTEASIVNKDLEKKKLKLGTSSGASAVATPDSELSAHATTTDSLTGKVIPFNKNVEESQGGEEDSEEEKAKSKAKGSTDPSSRPKIVAKGEKKKKSPKRNQGQRSRSSTLEMTQEEEKLEKLGIASRASLMEQHEEDARRESEDSVSTSVFIIEQKEKLKEVRNNLKKIEIMKRYEDEASVNVEQEKVENEDLTRSSQTGILINKKQY